MKERPLIFQDWGIRAIRNVVPGSWPAVAIDPSKPIKWQTRRVMKPQPPGDFEAPHQISDGSWVVTENEPPDILTNYPITCSYAVGDQIWTRETFTIWNHDNKEVWYQADCDTPGHADIGWYNATLKNNVKRWSPSIHMPRWACRDNLLIHNIRVERVQDISIDDAFAEEMPMSYERGNGPWNDSSVIVKFENVWNALHVKPKLYKSDVMRLGVETPYYVSFPWDKASRNPRTEINGKRHCCYPNPYVWVYEMGRL